ncbi:MAG TPA: LysR family transcriptional regulator [Gemmatimonadaceae bacterium]|nr:LysR family transcriptional regulator [Gemmatimonadaceae bacterium]
MPTPDLNLLIALNALLAEGSVVRAGQRLRLSPSAMSRTLARLRVATGDPLMVRAGRGLVPTPRAIELRELTARLVQDAESVLRPAGAPRLDQVVRTFSLRTSDGFVETFGPALVARVGREAPDVRLRFLQKTDKDPAPLREGLVDLETGVIVKGTAPEFRQQMLFRDRYVGVVRAGHPLARGKVTLARFAAAAHVGVSRRGVETVQVDEPIAAAGAGRRIVTIVGGFAAALALARGTDLVASVPGKHTRSLREGMHTFRLPFATPDLSIAMLWHPRMDADAVHRWLRTCVREVCAAAAAKDERV